VKPDALFPCQLEADGDPAHGSQKQLTAGTRVVQEAQHERAVRNGVGLLGAERVSSVAADLEPPVRLVRADEGERSDGGPAGDAIPKDRVVLFGRCLDDDQVRGLDLASHGEHRARAQTVGGRAVAPRLGAVLDLLDLELERFFHRTLHWECQSIPLESRPAIDTLASKD